MIVFWFGGNHLFCQETKLSESIISIAEELAADDPDPEAVSLYIEKLYELYENPVRINSAANEEISKLFFLSDFQVKILADYLRSSGRIISVYELANIPGFDQETAIMMTPFISLRIKPGINSDSVTWRNTLITNLSARPFSFDTSSTGSLLKVLTKYKFTSGSFSGGITIEKDPGEKFFCGDPPLPDFLSANLNYSGSGIIRKLIIGDYSARFGQGTNINTGIRTGLSLTAPGYMSSSDEIKPYTSTDENNFFRGAACNLSYNNLALFIFWSKKSSDATLGSTSGLSEDHIVNFYSAGVHNTASLLQKKDAVSELAYGVNLAYNFNNIRIGMVWSDNRFSLPVSSTGNDPENIFNFTGNRNSLFTIYYNSLIKRILLYGEFSSNQFSRYAFVQGFSLRPSDRLTINLLVRNYNAGYISFHGKGPGNSSVNGNEQGILSNFTFEAAKHLFISAGCDIYYYPWLRYRCSSPSWGKKQEIRIRYLATEKLAFETSYNNRLSVVDYYESNSIPKPGQLKTRSIKASFRYSVQDNLTLGTRIDYKTVDPSGSKGMLMLQDMNYRFRQIPVTLWFRFCLFNTDDWNSRIYTYENDLLYSFSIPALSGEGSRSYMMIKWDIGNLAEIRLKYGITSLTGSRSVIDNKNELKLQFRIMF